MTPGRWHPHHTTTESYEQLTQRGKFHLPHNCTVRPLLLSFTIPSCTSNGYTNGAPKPVTTLDDIDGRTATTMTGKLEPSHGMCFIWRLQLPDIGAQFRPGNWSAVNLLKSDLIEVTLRTEYGLNLSVITPRLVYVLVL